MMGHFFVGTLILKKRWVFEALVRDDKDAVGLIAYALYKHKKHTLAMSLRKKAMKDEEIKIQVDTYHDQFLENDSVEEFRNKATDFLDKIIREVEENCKFDMEKKKRREIQQFKRDFIKKVKEYELSNKPWYKKLFVFVISGVPGIVSSFIIFSLIIGSSVFFVPEDTKQDILSSLVSEYLGIDTNLDN